MFANSVFAVARSFPERVFGPKQRRRRSRSRSPLKGQTLVGFDRRVARQSKKRTVTRTQQRHASSDESGSERLERVLFISVAGPAIAIIARPCLARAG